MCQPSGKIAKCRQFFSLDDFSLRQLQFLSLLGDASFQLKVPLFNFMQMTFTFREKFAVLQLQLPGTQYGSSAFEEIMIAKGLDNIIGSPCFHGVYSDILTPHASKDDNSNIGKLLLDLVQNLQTIFVRHHKIKKNEFENFFFQEIESAKAITCCLHTVTIAT